MVSYLLTWRYFNNINAGRSIIINCQLERIFYQQRLVWRRLFFLVVLISQDGFESDCPKSKFQTITSSSQLRSSRKQMFFSKCVLKNMCWSILLSWNRKLQQRYFPVNIVKFSRPASFIEHLRGLFCQFDEVTASYWTSADLLFLIKNTMWDGFYYKGL